MARDENPPFGRGETFYNGGTIDSSNLGGVQLEGHEWVFEDISYNVTGQVGAKPSRTNRKVRCRVVRNVGAVALLPKQCVTFQKTAGSPYVGRVDGKVCVDADRCYPVDEWLPAAGVPVNDLFWLVMEGPAMVKLDLASASTNFVTVGDPVIGLTAATSGATTAGRVQDQPQFLAALTNGLTAAQSGFLPNAVMNFVGRALSSNATTVTNSDLLVDVKAW